MAKRTPTKAATTQADLNARFMQALEAVGHTGYSAAKQFGTSEAVISNIRHGKNPPNVLLVVGVLEAYPALSVEWLMTGRGAMIK
jgi:hypothetical protein